MHNNGNTIAQNVGKNNTGIRKYHKYVSKKMKKKKMKKKKKKKKKKLKRL